MTATEKFKIGQRVKMTPEALAQGMDGVHVKRSTGVVKGFPKRASMINPAFLVRILRDGDRNVRTYHIAFWESVDEGDSKCSSN